MKRLVALGRNPLRSIMPKSRLIDAAELRRLAVRLVFLPPPGSSRAAHFSVVSTLTLEAV